MKWEAIKLQVAREVFTQVTRGVSGADSGAIAALFDAVAERRPFETSLDALGDRCFRVVEKWDIRAVGRLRELFPDAFPRRLRKGALVADMDDAGDWIVELGPEA